MSACIAVIVLLNYLVGSCKRKNLWISGKVIFYQVVKLSIYKATFVIYKDTFFQDKLDFSRSFSHLSLGFQEQLNREFGELVDTLISSIQSSQLHDNSEDDILEVICLSH